jgi:hypothetical protein
VRIKNQETIIFELEGLAIVAALQVFDSFVKGRRVVTFTNKQAAQTCFVKCKSTNAHMNPIIRAAFSESLGLVAWIERIPSQSNPADFFSREKVSSWQGLTFTPIDVTELWKSCLKERNGPS